MPRFDALPVPLRPGAAPTACSPGLRAVVKAPHRSAGVVPVMVDPVHRLPWVLLGRDAGGTTFSEFAGRVEHDEDFPAAAARELFEESCACVGFLDYRPTATRSGILSRTSGPGWVLDALARSFRSPDGYAARVEYEAEGTFRMIQRTVYAVRVPWDPHCVVRFRKTRVMLGGLRRILEHGTATREELAELQTEDLAQRDARHRYLLAHPAVEAEGADLDDPDPRPVVRRVLGKYLEKSEIAMLSFPELLRATRGIASAHDGSRVVLSGSSAPILRGVISDLRYRALGVPRAAPVFFGGAPSERPRRPPRAGAVRPAVQGPDPRPVRGVVEEAPG